MPDIPPKIKLPRTRRPQHRPQYGKLHQQLRELVLDRHPICTICRAAWSEHAHHLRPDATSVSDYAAVCPACHWEIHRREDS